MHHKILLACMCYVCVRECACVCAHLQVHSFFSFIFSCVRQQWISFQYLPVPVQTLAHIPSSETVKFEEEEKTKQNEIVVKSRISGGVVLHHIRWLMNGTNGRPKEFFRRKIYHFPENEVHVVEITDIRWNLRLLLLLLQFLVVVVVWMSPNLAVAGIYLLQHFHSASESCFLICPI